ncbi:MAG: mechanosensitive ion channel [bacterium]|nr:mechanosensitive ion channel [bacterium]
MARIRELIAGDSDIHADGVLANFTKFESSSLIIMVQCFTVSTDYAEYMRVRHRLLVNIKDEFEKLSIKFAFANQTVIISGPNSQGSREFPTSAN